MFCKNCGVQISEETKFCPSCGAAINSELEWYNINRVDKHPKI